MKASIAVSRTQAGSAKRLRLILMTTITTICGMAPIILPRDVLFSDLAAVLSGGLLAGTVLTLGVVPVLYSIFSGAGSQTTRGIKTQ